MNRMADALASTASTFARDDDPEFVRTAAPATLKMVEMMLDDQPSHKGLLLTACSGFAQYAYGFLQADADLRPANDPEGRVLKERASRMYERARGYCVRLLEARHPDFASQLRADAAAALARATKEDVPALYWMAVAAGGAAMTSANPLLRIGEIALVRASLARALALDEAGDHGALHEAMIAVEGLPALLGGSAARARQHFERAVELSAGQSVFAYVTMAGVAQSARDRAEFQRLLEKAVAVDIAKTPRLRLANVIAQRKARRLLEQGM